MAGMAQRLVGSEYEGVTAGTFTLWGYVRSKCSLNISKGPYVVYVGRSVNEQ